MEDQITEQPIEADSPIHALTKEVLAEILDNREYGEEITQHEKDMAVQAGLVVVFGASDDLIEFRGAIHDEADCWNGGTVFINQEGLCRKRESLAAITAVWAGTEGYSWTYQTDIPHVTFDILEGEDKYCRGIIFSMQDVPQATEQKS